MIARVSAMDAVGHAEAREQMHNSSVDVRASLSANDIVLMPTTTHTASLLGHFDSRSAAFDHDEFSRRSFRFAPFTDIFNIAGQPAASVFAGLSSEGLPIGVQIAGRVGEDRAVLAAAKRMAEVCGPAVPR